LKDQCFFVQKVTS